MAVRPGPVALVGPFSTSSRELSPAEAGGGLSDLAGIPLGFSRKVRGGI